MSSERRLDPVQTFQDFQESSATVLALLQARIDLELWLVTRTEGDDWIVLSAQDRGYGAKAGDVFRWSDSFCSSMVRGLGRRIAPDSALIEAYAEAPIGQQVEIGAYVGESLDTTHRNGDPFMFCPECEGEFKEGIAVCPDCGIALVHQLPEHDNRPLVAVFSTADPAVLPVVTSLLEETDIPYTIKGEETFGLFPGATVGLAIDPKGRAAEVLVPSERADEARQLLSDLEGEATDGT